MAGATSNPDVLGCRLRAARLDASGATPAGATNLFVTDLMVELALEDNVETGTEIGVRTACGDYAFKPFRLPDYVKWYNGTLTIAQDLEELDEMLCGGTLITSGGNTIGYAEPRLGVRPPGFGVSLELWSERLDAAGFQAATNGWIWTTVFRAANFRKGPRRWFLGANSPTYTFEAFENLNYGNGPNNDWPGPSAGPRAYVLSNVAPPAASVGYQTTPAQI